MRASGPATPLAASGRGETRWTGRMRRAPAPVAPRWRTRRQLAGSSRSAPPVSPAAPQSDLATPRGGRVARRSVGEPPPDAAPDPCHARAAREGVRARAATDPGTQHHRPRSPGSLTPRPVAILIAQPLHTGYCLTRVGARRRTVAQPSAHGLRTASARRAPGPSRRRLLGQKGSIPCGSIVSTASARWNRPTWAGETFTRSWRKEPPCRHRRMCSKPSGSSCGPSPSSCPSRCR